MQFFDSHAHFNDEKFKKDRNKLIPEIYKSGITKIVCAGYNLESSLISIDLSKRYEYIYATCGISPNDIQSDDIEKKLTQLEDIIKNEKIVAIGEIGLDYYWNKVNKSIQQEHFIRQIEIANKYNLPIVIHTREAVTDTLDIIKKEKCNKGGVFHCCPLNIELIKEALKLDFYISFAGPITFKNSKNANQVVQIVPLEKLIIETDSPYLAPEPVRGTINDPRNVKYIAEKIAQIKGLSIQSIAEITYENAVKLFDIKNK